MSLQQFIPQKLNPIHLFKNFRFKNQQPDQGRPVPVRHKDYEGGSLAISPFVQLQQEINRLIDSFEFPSLIRSGFPVKSSGIDSLWASLSQNSSLNVAADADEYVVTVEATGLAEKDLELEVIDDQLVVSGNRLQERKHKDRHGYQLERHVGTFRRVLSLPRDALSSNIRASMRKGLLTIRIPRQKSAHRITIVQH